MSSRRQFLQIAAGTAGLIGLRAAGLFSTARAESMAPADRPLKLLFLGGTGFIGPHQIEYALERGHEVTMFNRGNRSGLYGDQVEEILGNRDTKIDEGLKPLEGDRTWDVVIDNSGYIPRHVRDSVELLKDRCGRYLYISTVAVYDDSAPGAYAEDGKMHASLEPGVESVTWETYGPLKAECDRIVQDALGQRATLVRPTYIIGPGDRTDRFTYWADRIHRGGDIVGCAHRERHVQTIDVRDLCPWIIQLAENNTAGVFNAAGPVWTREGFLWGINATYGGEVRFHWPTQQMLESAEMSPPMLDGGTTSTHFPNEAARAAGLTTRSLADSTDATLKWWRSQPEDRRANPRRWPTAEQERAILLELGVG